MKREGNGQLLGQAGHNVDELCIRAALQLAAEEDAYFSPTVDTVRLNVGFEYEILLQHRLASLGVAFQNEDEMRDEGRSKTRHPSDCAHHCQWSSAFGIAGFE